jgi:CP family cyanate transporter-like MFS transporter
LSTSTPTAGAPRPPVRARPEHAGAGTVVAIVLLALNLRPVFSSLSPLVDTVRDDLGLSAAAAGLLTTLPVLCLGMFAPLAPRLSARYPIERLLVVCALATGAGAAFRGIGSYPALIAGGVLAGSAIAVAQAVIPILIRARFPQQSGTLTGAFSMAITGGATLGAALAVPVADALGGSWQAELAIWLAPALLAAAVWVPRAAATRTVVERGGGAPLRASLLAWCVALYFGVQSMTFYATLAWLPSALEADGRSSSAAGALLALSALSQVPTAFLVPFIAHRRRTQLLPLLVVVTSATVGIAGVMQAPGAALLWVVLIGLGQGGMLGLAMMLPLLRSGDARTTGSLTAMALGIGYTVAAAGPWILGAVHDASGDWTAPLAVLLGMTLLELVPGIPATMDRTLRA